MWGDKTMHYICDVAAGGGAEAVYSVLSLVQQV